MSTLLAFGFSFFCSELFCFFFSYLQNCNDNFEFRLPKRRLPNNCNTNWTKLKPRSRNWTAPSTTSTRPRRSCPSRTATSCASWRKPSRRSTSCRRSRSLWRLSWKTPRGWPTRKAASVPPFWANSATWSTTWTTFASKPKKKPRARPTCRDNSARQTPRRSSGAPSTSPRVWLALKNLRRRNASSRLVWLRPKRPLSRSTRRSSLWRRPNSVWPPKSRTCNSRSTVPRLLPMLPRRNRRHSTRSLENGNSRSTILPPSSTPAKRSAATTAQNSSDSRVTYIHFVQCLFFQISVTNVI